LHTVRHRLVDLGQHFTHAPRNVERVRDGLLYDADGDGVLAAVAALAPLVEGTELDTRHLAELHLMVAGQLDDDVAEFLGRDEASLGQDAELAIGAFDAP
jgi:hypothetical protein